MNFQRVDSYLQAQLADNGTWFTQPARAMAVQSATREYSRWIPLIRPIGSGGVWLDAEAGQNVVLTVGGPFSVGQQLVLSYMTPWQETATVQSIAPWTEAGLGGGQPMKVTMTGNLSSLHPAGDAIFAINPNAQSGFAGINVYNGLNLIAGQPDYPLPYDFLDPEQQSFDVAIGAQWVWRRQDNFYDGPYRKTAALSGVGPGQSTLFGGYGSYGVNGWGWPTGFTSSGGNGIQGIGGSGGSMEQGAVFTGSNPQILSLRPCPSQSSPIFFNYFAQQQLETINDSDLEALCQYAQFSLLSTLATKIGQGIDYKDGDVTEDRSRNVKVLTDKAMAAKDRFDETIMDNPRIATG